MSDLRKFFQGSVTGLDGTKYKWKNRVNSKGVFFAHVWNFYLRIEPDDVMYEVHVWAKDDPSDSDTEVTSSPAEFLSEFLSTGTSGDEFLKTMSSHPKDVSHLFKRMAFKIEQNKSFSYATQTLRRVAFKIKNPDIKEKMNLLKRYADVSLKEDVDLVEEMKKTLKSKGWEVFTTEEGGVPTINVDMEGFEATVKLDTIMYKVNYFIDGEMVHEDYTNDPIGSYQNYLKSAEHADTIPFKTPSGTLLSRE